MFYFSFFSSLSSYVFFYSAIGWFPHRLCPSCFTLLAFVLDGLKLNPLEAAAPQSSVGNVITFDCSDQTPLGVKPLRKLSSKGTFHHRSLIFADLWRLDAGKTDFIWYLENEALCMMHKHTFTGKERMLKCNLKRVT